MRIELAKAPNTKLHLKPILSTKTGEIIDERPHDKYNIPTARKPKFPNPLFFKITDIKLCVELNAIYVSINPNEVKTTHEKLLFLVTI